MAESKRGKQLQKGGMDIPVGKLKIGGVAVTATANEINTGTVAGLTATAAELNKLAGATGGTAVASKAVVLDANKQNAGAVIIPPTVVASGDAAIALKQGRVAITKGSAAALTLADPTAGDDDFKELEIVAITAFAHTVSNAAGSGFNAGGAGSDVGTFGGARGDNLCLMAYQGAWYVMSKVNVTLA